MLKPRNGGSIWEDTELVRWEKYIGWRFETPILDTSHFIVLIMTLSNTCFSFKESSTRVLNLQASLQDPTLLSNLKEVSFKLESMPISWRLLHVAIYEWKIRCVHWVEWVQEWHKWWENIQVSLQTYERTFSATETLECILNHESHARERTSFPWYLQYLHHLNLFGHTVELHPRTLLDKYELCGLLLAEMMVNQSQHYLPWRMSVVWLLS